MSPAERSASVWAVVVARAGERAKSRLAAALGPLQRTELALAMLSDVLDVCRRSNLAGVVAVVDAPAARNVAQARGALVITDSGAGDMNAAVQAGVQCARDRAADTVIVVPGDVPLFSSADLQAMLNAAGDAPRAVVVGASRDGGGTNALLMRPPDVIAPGFGPPSVGRHVLAGKAAGALTVVRSQLGLALDIDTPRDLLDLLAAQPSGHTGAALALLLPAHALVCS